MKISPMTAQSYLSALRSHHVDLRLPTTVFDDETLKRIIRGAKRQYGISSIRHRKEITKDILISILAHLRNTHDDINIRAAFCTAFAAFLRLGEFAWDTWTSQSHLIQLSRGSIQFTSDGNALLHLPASKTDQFRQGTIIPLAASHDSTCPVSALKTLFHRYPNKNIDPLFTRVIGSFDGTWLIQRLHSLLRAAGINPDGFSGHSFRRGAANSALQAGISKQDIKTMGRWKSDAIDRYFSAATQTQHLLTLSKQLHSRPGPSISTVSSPNDPTHFPARVNRSHCQQRKNR